MHCIASDTVRVPFEFMLLTLIIERGALSPDHDYCLHCIAGLERYKIRGIIQNKPVVIAEVEMLEDAEDTSPEVQNLSQPPVILPLHLPAQDMQYQREIELLQAKELVQDIAQMYKNILMLNVKMKKYKATPVRQQTFHPIPWLIHHLSFPLGVEIELRAAPGLSPPQLLQGEVQNQFTELPTRGH